MANEYINMGEVIESPQKIKIVTGERASGKTTGAKLWLLEHGGVYLWLTRKSDDILTAEAQWLTDLQSHDLALDYEEEIEKLNVSRCKLVHYSNGQGRPLHLFFVPLSFYRKLRGIEFSYERERIGGIFFDEFVTDDPKNYLIDEPKKLIDLWTTISRRDAPPFICLMANTDQDNTPYNAFWDISFFEEGVFNNDNILVRRANGFGFKETPIGALLNAVMPSYITYAEGGEKEVKFAEVDLKKGEKWFVLKGTLTVYEEHGITKVGFCPNYIGDEVVLIDVTGRPTPILDNYKFRVLLGMMNENIVFSDRVAVRLWAHLQTYAL